MLTINFLEKLMVEFLERLMGFIKEILGPPCPLPVPNTQNVKIAFWYLSFLCQRQNGKSSHFCTFPLLFQRQKLSNNHHLAHFLPVPKAQIVRNSTLLHISLPFPNVKWCKIHHFIYLSIYNNILYI